MTLQDAIKTGEPFKRKDWETWVLPRSYCIFHKIEKHTTYLTKEDALAEDWEVKTLNSIKFINNA